LKKVFDEFEFAATILLDKLRPITQPCALIDAMKSADSLAYLHFKRMPSPYL
jgi:hypothetical protein